MKNNIKETIPNYLIILLGIILMVYPFFGQSNAIELFYYTTAIIGTIRLIEFIFQKDKSDKENLYTAIACYILPLLGIFKLTPKIISISLLVIIWTCFMSIVKLIKLDYLHDNKSNKLNIKLSGSIIFTILGVVIGYGLLFDSKIKEVLLGLLITFYGTLDYFKDYINILLENLKKPKKTNK